MESRGLNQSKNRFETMGNNFKADRSPFTTTPWSLVANAANPITGREALAQLLDRYMPALRVHLDHHLGHRSSEIEDLLNAFVADKVIADNLCIHANRSKGRFRNFLLTSLDNYVASHFRRANAKKRRAEAPNVHIDQMTSADNQQAPPSEMFDVVWARQVIADALERTESLYRATGRPHVFALFDARVLRPMLADETAPGLDELTSELGFESAQQASNALVGAKRNFSRMLRDVVREYAPNEDVDDELRDLRAILATHGARRRP